MLNPGKVGGPWPADPGPLIGKEVVLTLSKVKYINSRLCASFEVSMRLYSSFPYSSNLMLIFFFILTIYIIIAYYNNNL